MILQNKTSKPSKFTINIFLQQQIFYIVFFMTNISSIFKYKKLVLVSIRIALKTLKLFKKAYTVYRFFLNMFYKKWECKYKLYGYRKNVSFVFF